MISIFTPPLKPLSDKALLLQLLDCAAAALAPISNHIKGQARTLGFIADKTGLTDLANKTGLAAGVTKLFGQVADAWKAAGERAKLADESIISNAPSAAGKDGIIDLAELYLNDFGGRYPNDLGGLYPNLNRPEVKDINPGEREYFSEILEAFLKGLFQKEEHQEYLPL